MKAENWENEWSLKRMFLAFLGTLLYVAGINLFIVPCGFYTGGMLGICQVIRTVLSDYMGISFQFDIAGIIYYILNIPLFILAWKRLTHGMLYRTLLCVTLSSILFSVVPIPETSLIGSDPLASCLIGGIIGGGGCGLILQAGCSSGGLDLLALVIVKEKADLSVGKISGLVNLVLYSICLILFDIRVALYSIMVAVATSIALDKMHYQNINVEVKIISRAYSNEMKQEIMRELGRGITLIPSTGCYTGDASEIMYVLVSKYEIPHLREIVIKYDPSAFIVFNEGVRVAGHYLKKL